MYTTMPYITIYSGPTFEYIGSSRTKEHLSPEFFYACQMSFKESLKYLKFYFIFYYISILSKTKFLSRKKFAHIIEKKV